MEQSLKIDTLTYFCIINAYEYLYVSTHGEIRKLS